MLEDDFKKLLDKKTENKNLDYKEKLNWLDSDNEEKLKIIKDILAMANTQDGGRIIFGVTDDFDLKGLSEEDYNSFDTTRVNDFLQSYTDPKFSCFIHKYILYGDKRFILIDVPEFSEIPIICKKNGHSSKENKLILNSGQIYHRTEGATSQIISSSEEMRNFLQRCIVKKGDQLLRDIKSLILKGVLERSEETEKYFKDIQETKEFVSQSVGEKITNYACWELLVYPTSFKEDRIENQAKIKNFIQETEVYLRGWNFPHTDGNNNSNFLRGVQSYTDFSRHIEAYRAYQDGLFFWTEVLYDDLEGTKKEKKVLSFIDIIWTIAEIIIFLSRYYDIVCPDENLYMSLKLNGLLNRELSAEARILLRKGYISKEEKFIFEKEIDVLNLRVNQKDIIIEIVQKLFRIFNLENISNNVIESWIDKLMQRTY